MPEYEGGRGMYERNDRGRLDAYDEVLDLIDKRAREGQVSADRDDDDDAPPIGLLQVLPPDHPLVKYGSWDKVPEDEQWRMPRYFPASSVASRRSARKNTS